MDAFENEKYPGQQKWIVRIDGYPCEIAVKVIGEEFHLITLWPSRKFK